MRIMGFTPRELADVVTLALFGTAIVMLMAVACVCLWRALPIETTSPAAAASN